MINRIDDKTVKIIRLVSGEEICCKFPLHKNQLPENSKLLRLQEPMLIKYDPRIPEHGISDYIALETKKLVVDLYLLGLDLFFLLLLLH